MTATLPETTHIRLDRRGPVLHLWLNRPEVRNALSAQMVQEIQATFDAIAGDRGVRVVVIRGTGGTFCAGGDIKNMQAASAAPPTGAVDETRAGNRRYGAMLQTIDEAPQATIAVVEGAALGGGIGFASTADITIAKADAQFAMTEVMLGVVPAAISPFVVRRIGLTAARRFAVSGARLDGHGAKAVGFAHEVAETADALDAAVVAAIKQILKCAPGAVAETKWLMLRAASPVAMGDLLEAAADSFAAAVRAPEGREGTAAFIEKRKPAWVATWVETIDT
jgi:isohexenylglutaconyl-CoA hydratase